MANNDSRTTAQFKAAFDAAKAVTSILKKRFPNLTTEEVGMLAMDIVTVVIEKLNEGDIE